MSHSASLLDLMAIAQAGKEYAVNALADAASPASLYGRRASTCGGLQWGWYGGTLLVDGVLTAIANGTLTLTASATNYVEADRSGAVSANTTGYTAGSVPLYTIVCGSATVTSYSDDRVWVQPEHVTSKVTVTVTTANVTLSAAQARARYLILSGTLTGNRNVVVPNHWQGIVFCNNAGAFTTTVKTASGSGIVVGQGKRAILLADGTNVVRVTADA